MSWAALGLSAVLASTPSASVSSARRLNVEPFVLAAAGVAGVGVGVWQLLDADARYKALLAIPSQATSPAEAALLLQEAKSLVFRSKSQTVAGVALIAVGAAAVVGALVWLLVEGLTTTDWLVAPTAQGISLVGRF